LVWKILTNAGILFRSDSALVTIAIGCRRNTTTRSLATGVANSGCEKFMKGFTQTTRRRIDQPEIEGLTILRAS
jgi:hypothetical protein